MRDCIAADGAHEEYPVGDARSDLFGGWTWIIEDGLDYVLIIAALENGDFYASNGPEIFELYCAGGTVHIKTTEITHIPFQTAGRRGNANIAVYGGSVNAASDSIGNDGASVRVTVRDCRGNPQIRTGGFVPSFCL